MSSIGLQTSKSELVSLGDAALTVTAADSGKTFLMNTILTAARTVTLPLAANAKGCRFRFVKALADCKFNLTVTAGAAVVKGTILDAIVAGSAVRAVDHTSLSFDDLATVGSFINLECDGTFYYAFAVDRAAADIVLA